MDIYGLDFNNESSFWDEVKLRAMNNYGEWESGNIMLAVEDILTDAIAMLQFSKQIKLLEKEIVAGQD